jgi:PAS domain S-box-containing protein
MTEYLLVLFRFIIVAATLLYLVYTGRRGNIQDQKGWPFIIVGFTLLFFGLAISLFDSLQYYDLFTLLGIIDYQNFLESTIGYTFGFLFLGIGFYRWVPGIVSGRRAERNIGQFSDELALNVTLRTLELTEVIDRLEQEISNRKQVEEALRNSEELYSNIVESMSDGIMVLDEDFNITHWSRSMEKISRIPREEVINRHKPPWKVYPQFSKEGVDKMMQLAMTGSVVKRDNIAHQFKDGSNGYTSEIYLPLKSDDGKIRGIVGVVQDITQQKKAMSELEETYKIINGSPAIVFRWNNSPGWPVEFVSSNAKDTFGYSAQDFMAGNITYAEVIHPDDEDRYADEVKRYSKNKEISQFVHEPYRIIRKNGDIRWLDNRTYIIRGKTGRVTHYQGVVLDVTDRKRAEEALRDSEVLYSSIVESMWDGIIVTDRNFHYTYWNQAMENISKIKREDAVNSGKLPWDLFPHFTEQGIDKMMKDAMDGTAVSRDDIPYRLADGTEGFTSEMFLPLRKESGAIRGIVGIIRDITEKKRLENHLQQTKKSHAVADMASGIAHDFNNMLTSVVGFISLAKMNLKAGRPALQELEKAEKTALRSSELSDTLITFSRGNKPVKKRVQIHDFLKRSLYLTLSGSNIKFECLSAADDLMVEIDENQVAQAIYSIIKNAREAMPGGGKLIAATEGFSAGNRNALNLQPGKYVRISITDQGQGINRAHLDRIFDPYFSTKKRGTQKGMGLGLSIAHAIIKNHKGNIAVKTRIGKGSTFMIYLPQIDTEIDKTVIPDPIAPGQAWDGVGKAKKILIMDDEESLLDVAGQMLNRLGFETDFATCGEEAIQKYRDAMNSDLGFDAVILDLTVKGGMGGEEALINLLDIDPQVTAFVSSGYAEDTVMINYREHGFAGAIVKPYNIDELGREISNVNDS